MKTSRILQRINIFAWLYGTVGLIRRRFYKKGIISSARFKEVVTISIGNLSMGGTGKTPHTEFLIRQLANPYKVATLSRGYGRKTKGFILANELSSNELTSTMIGDEPLQMHKKFPEIQVAVCEQRAIGISKLLATPTPPDIILLDDAYQHLQVTPDCHILLTEYEHPYFDDFVVPAGHLREFPCASKNADIIIVTKCPASLTQAEKKQFLNALKPTENQEVFFSTFEYSEPIPITPRAKKFTLSAETPIVVLTGIARPEPLLKEISNKYHTIKHFKFQDHHQFTEQEIQALTAFQFADNQKEKAIFSTEKDISRLLTNETKKNVSLQPIFTISIKVKILFEQEKILIKKLNSYVRKD